MLDDDDGPERYAEDPDGPAVLPRKPKASLLKKMAGDVPTTSVGSSLDSFITKANEGLLDLKENPPNRERELQARVDELEKQLLSAESRAAKAEAAKRAAIAEPVMPIAPQSRGWGGIVVAFVLGCGAMFAVSTLLLKKEAATTAPEQKQVATPTPPAPTSVTPIETPSTPPAPTQPAQPAVAQTPTTQPETQPEQVAKTPETTTAKVAAKKTPKHTSSTSTTTTTTTPTGTGTQTKPPDPAHVGSDELYNPF